MIKIINFSNIIDHLINNIHIFARSPAEKKSETFQMSPKMSVREVGRKTQINKSALLPSFL